MVILFQGFLVAFGVMGVLCLVAVTPWVLANFNLVNIVLFWFVVVLFGNLTGKLVLPMLPKISLYQIVLLILIFAFFSQVVIGKLRLLPLTVIEIAMFLFCIIAFISQVNAGIVLRKGMGIKIANLFNGFVFPFAVFYLSKHLIDSGQKLGKVLIFFIGIGLYLTLTGICELTPPLSGLVFPRDILDPYVGIHFGRARGPFLQAAVNGTVLGMIFSLGLYLSLSEYVKPARRKICQVITALMPIGIFLTNTRACWLGFLASTLVAAKFYPKFRKVFLIGLILFAMVATIKLVTKEREKGRFSQMGPIHSRIHIYNASLRMLIEKPFFGFGFDNFQFTSPRYFTAIKGVPYYGETVVPHDTFLGILVELGLVGFIPLIIIYLCIFSYSLRLYHHLPRDDLLGKDMIAIFWSVGMVFLVNMQFIDMRYFVFPNALFFMLAGIVVGLYQKRLAGNVSVFIP